jgi:hypothetical protein
MKIAKGPINLTSDRFLQTVVNGFSGLTVYSHFLSNQGTAEARHAMILFQKHYAFVMAATAFQHPSHKPHKPSAALFLVIL